MSALRCSTIADNPKRAQSASLPMAGAPAAGATGGYVLSLEAGPDEAEVAGALLDWAPAHGLRLGVPLVQTAADAEGHFAVGLPLLGGRF